MKIIFFAFLLIISTVFSKAFACNQVFNSSNPNEVLAALAVPGIEEICLQDGVYNFNVPVVVAEGKQLKGLGVVRDSVVLRSSADRVLIVGNNTLVQNLLIEGAPGYTPGYGVLSLLGNDQIIWGVKIRLTQISIGINGSSNVRVWDTIMQENGTSNSAAEPNLWINRADNIEILWGNVNGRANGPGGDGEIACYDSKNVNVYGTHIVNSGASAIYFVNCDDSTIDSLTIIKPMEWGIDVVGGSDNILVQNNYVTGARYGGSIFHEDISVGGTFINNQFVNNRKSGWGAMCNGINIKGQPNNVVMHNNTSNAGQVFCIFNN